MSRWGFSISKPWVRSAPASIARGPAASPHSSGATVKWPRSPLRSSARAAAAVRWSASSPRRAPASHACAPSSSRAVAHAGSRSSRDAASHTARRSRCSPCWRCGAPSTRSGMATVPRRLARRSPASYSGWTRASVRCCRSSSTCSAYRTRRTRRLRSTPSSGRSASMVS